MENCQTEYIQYLCSDMRAKRKVQTLCVSSIIVKRDADEASLFLEIKTDLETLQVLYIRKWKKTKQNKNRQHNPLLVHVLRETLKSVNTQHMYNPASFMVKSGEMFRQLYVLLYCYMQLQPVDQWMSTGSLLFTSH